MQHAAERVERPGESQEALDGKKVVKKDLARPLKKLTKYIVPTYRIFLMKTWQEFRLMTDKAHVSGL